MTRLTMVGITHMGASLTLLERVAVRRDDRPRMLEALRTSGLSEAVLLSTCSRVEIYAGNASAEPTEVVEMLLDVMAEHSAATDDELRAVAEVRTGHAVVEHLFNVTAGLSSRVLGEAEILGQARMAFREALAAGMTGQVLARLFPAALRSGAQVRAATSLSGHARSLGHRAVDVGLASLGGCPDPTVLVVGSGQMAVAAVEHLAGLGIQPRVAARDEAYAARLAGPASVCPLPELTWGITAADLLICATSAAQYVVTMSQVRRAMTGRTRPLTIVDVSVPRNVDSAVAEVPRVTLIDIEGLAEDGSADPGLAAALSAGAAMASHAAQRFTEGLAARQAGLVIAALRKRVEDRCHEELVRTGCLVDIDSDRLARSAHAIAGKLLHRPTVAARQAGAAGDADALRHLCDLFGVPLAEVGLARVDLTDLDLAEVGGDSERIAMS